MTSKPARKIKSKILVAGMAILFLFAIFLSLKADFAISVLASGPAPTREPEKEKIYQNIEHGFSIQYPSRFKPTLTTPSLSWFSLRTEDDDKKTNLREAALILRVQNDEDAFLQCRAFKPNSVYQYPKYGFASLPTVEFGLNTFYKDLTEESGMGHLRKEISYRTYHAGTCYEIALYLHTLNIDFLDRGLVSEFEETEIVQKFHHALATFTLLDVSTSSETTFPPPAWQHLPEPEPATQSQSIPPQTGENEEGIDVSRWQGEVTWSEVYNAGYHFAFARSSVGDETEPVYEDPYFSTNMAEGLAAGMLIGPYHVGVPDLGTDPISEAHYFLSVAEDYFTSDYLRPVLDMERKGDLNNEELSAWIHAWMTEVREKTGIEPIIYVSSYYAKNYLEDSINQYDLWIAHWTCDPNDPPDTGIWPDWQFWQYYAPGGCGANFVPGIEGSVDWNLFHGDLPALQDFLVKTLTVSLTASPPMGDLFNVDLTASIAGNASEPIDYAFWWDCADPGLQVDEVAAVCGSLPTPAPGTCAQNQNGMQCLAVANETQAASHSYQIEGTYTAKVIARRENAPLAGDEIRVNVPKRAVGDFDGDGMSDPAKFYPDTGTVWWLASSTGSWDGMWLGGDTFDYVTGDFDGDGMTDPSKFYSGTGTVWWVESSTGTMDGQWLGPDTFGYVSDSDFDGDGMTDPAKFYESTGTVWWMESSTGTLDGMWLGGDTFTYVPGSDFDGDGKTDPSKFYESTGTVWWVESSTGTMDGTWLGGDTFTYVPRSDFDGDGMTDPAKFYESTGNLWWVASSTGSIDGIWLGRVDTFTFVGGNDFDGDGITDPAKFDATTGILAWLKSSTGTWDSADLGTGIYDLVN